MEIGSFSVGYDFHHKYNEFGNIYLKKSLTVISHSKSTVYLDLKALYDENAMGTYNFNVFIILSELIILQDNAKLTSNS